jgi:hypothetical protein
MGHFTNFIEPSLSATTRDGSTLMLKISMLHGLKATDKATDAVSFKIREGNATTEQYEAHSAIESAVETVL